MSSQNPVAGRQPGQPTPSTSRARGQSLLGLGRIVIPSAHVIPTNAAGTVQIKDGTVNLSSPVRVWTVTDLVDSR